ncbi:hypothetical protein [uncultured Enterovirga sp.]|uniref:hypothetical protein n=1 Tax=uncultured Enterovirga sp. TaxID=2026352 RepID=UPI0035CAD01F
MSGTPDAIPITWRVTSIGGHTNDPNDGTAYDGSAPIGRAMLVSDGHVELFGAWWWSMFATGCVSGLDHARNHGRAATREAAKAAVEERYRDLCAAHPDNRSEMQAHDADARERAEMWERRGELMPAPLVSARDAADA